MDKEHNKIGSPYCIIDTILLNCRSLELRLFNNLLYIKFYDLLTKPTSIDRLNKEKRELLSLRIDEARKTETFRAILKMANQELYKSKVDVLEKDLEKQALYMMQKGEHFEKINIKEEESFWKINEYIYIMKFILKAFKKRLEPVKGQYDELTFNVICMCLTLMSQLKEEYFALMGYWKAKLEEKEKRRDSGKGQKEAKEKRLDKILNTISENFSTDADELELDKGMFYKLVCDAFEGAENYPHHHKTLKTYKEYIEGKLGKKIIFKKKKN